MLISISKYNFVYQGKKPPSRGLEKSDKITTVLTIENG